MAEKPVSTLGFVPSLTVFPPSPLALAEFQCAPHIEVSKFRHLNLKVNPNIKVYEILSVVGLMVMHFFYSNDIGLSVVKWLGKSIIFLVRALFAFLESSCGKRQLRLDCNELTGNNIVIFYFFLFHCSDIK